MANKKPTMKEVKTVIDNILIHMSNLDKGLRGLDSALSSYIEFKKDRDKCGKPGINGGSFASPDIKFGANCYGVKPSGAIVKPKDPYCKKKPFCSMKKNKNASSKLSTDDISGFNDKKWSEFG